MHYKSFKSRFNPDGECQIVAIDFVYFFHNAILRDKKELGAIKKLSSMLDFLANNNFSFIVSTPFLSILSVNFWKLKLKFPDAIRIGMKEYTQKKEELNLQKCNYSVIIEETAKKLYGLKREKWTHFVVYYVDFNDKITGIFDPLKCILENEFKQIFNKFEMLSEVEIDKISHLKILIWKK